VVTAPEGDVDVVEESLEGVAVGSDLVPAVGKGSGSDRSETLHTLSLTT